jgi:hypothetical protein
MLDHHTTPAIADAIRAGLELHRDTVEAHAARARI